MSAPPLDRVVERQVLDGHDGRSPRTGEFVADSDEGRTELLDRAARLETLGADLFAAECVAAAAMSARRSGRSRLTDRRCDRLEEVCLHLEGATAPILARAGTRTDLTDRERDVTALVRLGLDNVAIPDRLGVSKRTVETHLRMLRAKLGASP